ncbi:DMT family transporter [Ottowia thiooxydans]|uniref:Drug/metabolite transporter (DMT)-like permease n=1 Tax=Ottowia thiooxydans TaxID=219182 RepID=A0ABV2Q7S9_9BURK
MSTVRQENLDGRAAALLLVCCAFWGFQQVLVKATLPELAPLFQASIRFVGATLILLLWCGWRGVSLRSPQGSFVPGLLVGLLFAGEFACMFIGLQHTTASRLTVFLYTSPFWVALLLPLFVPTERLRPPQWIGLACAFVAIVFALWDSFAHGRTEETWHGDLLGLAAGLFWGLTTVIIRSTRLAGTAPAPLLMYQVSVSAVVLPVLSLMLGETWNWQWSAFATTSIVLQTVIGAFASFLAWMWLLTRYQATKISAFVFLTPLFALLFGALWLGEAITPNLMAAMALVAFGIVLVNRKAPTRT